MEAPVRVCVSLLPLIAQLRQENEEFQRQLASYRKDKLALANCKARIKADTEKMGHLQWEHEVLTQRFAQVSVVSSETFHMVCYAVFRYLNDQAPATILG